MNKDKLFKIEEKLDSIVEKLNETNTILAANTQSLIIHEKRTDIAEKNIEMLQIKFEKNIEDKNSTLMEIENKLNPIRDHVNLVNAIFKYVIPGLAAGILFLFRLGIVKF